jgi:hypothetical protein
MDRLQTLLEEFQRLGKLQNMPAEYPRMADIDTHLHNITIELYAPDVHSLMTDEHTRAYRECILEIGAKRFCDYMVANSNHLQDMQSMTDIGVVGGRFTTEASAFAHLAKLNRIISENVVLNGAERNYKDLHIAAKIAIRECFTPALHEMRVDAFTELEHLTHAEYIRTKYATKQAAHNRMMELRRDITGSLYMTMAEYERFMELQRIISYAIQNAFQANCDNDP